MRRSVEAADQEAHAAPPPVPVEESERLADLVLRNPVCRAVLARGHRLGVPDWWLTAGAVFQTVWNVVEGREPTAGIADYDLFYYDARDLSWEAEDAVIRRASELFADLDAKVEVRNEARVHLWYEQRFGVSMRPFASSCDAIDHFAATTCCVALTMDAAGTVRTYAPHGIDDVLALHLKPNPVLAPQAVYEAKAAAWKAKWPRLTVEPWPSGQSATEHRTGPTPRP